MLISQRIEKLACAHDDSRRTIGTFLVEQAGRFESLTMADIARETFTSKATLVRFAKQLGYEGWTEFARDYSREIDRQRENVTNIDHSIPFAPGATAGSILHAVCTVRSEGAWLTEQINDPRDFERACNLMLRAKRIAMFGYGFNAPAIDSFARKMTQIGVSVIRPAQDQYTQITMSLEKGDVLIAVSYSGTNENNVMLRFLQDARDRGVVVIGITSEGENYLREHSDVVLSILSCESLYNKIGTFSTEASLSCLLDTLYACYFARDYGRNLRYKVDNSRIVERDRQGS